MTLRTQHGCWCSTKLFAFLGIFLGRQLGLPYLDGAASIVIGLLLCVVAVLMVYESKGLLIGEGLDRETLKSARALVEADPAVERVQHSAERSRVEWYPRQAARKLCSISFRGESWDAAAAGGFRFNS